MKIFDINKSDSIYNVNNKRSVPFWGLKMNAPLSKDTVSFSGRLKQNFAYKKDALQYYKNIGNEVNKSLQDDDELTAFDILGYDVESDFDTDKITINGDYKPFFVVSTGKNQSSSHYISYEEAGIDEENLLRNVEKITGKKYVSPLFKPDADYVIDKTIKYVGKSGKNVELLLAGRADEAKYALEQGECQKALNILGYVTDSDEQGNITLKNGYSAILLNTNEGLKTLASYGIDENALLARVVKIQGDAEFQKGFSPDHFIETNSIKIADDYRSYGEDRRIATEFAKSDPSFVKKMQKVNQAIARQDSYSALKELGYDVSKDNDGNITVNGDLDSYYLYNDHGLKCDLFYSDLGINSDDLLKNVKHIKGDLSISGTKLKKLDKGLKADGTVYCGRNNNESLFDDFLSLKSISERYEGLSPVILQNFVNEGALNPSLKTVADAYFTEIEGKNKEFLDGIISRRDEILTSKELADKYSVSRITVDHLLQKGVLKPYAVSDLGERSYYLKSNGYLFDIADESNLEALKILESRGKQRSNNSQKTDVSRNKFVNACLRNSVRCVGDNSNTKRYPAKALEKLGYGSKADIIANCKLRTNAYELKRYFLTNDVYDISRADITDILLNARHNNPALVKLGDLTKILGENKKDFMNAVIADKINVITQNPYRLTTPGDYIIDLSDEKNYEYFKSVNNSDFQTWLDNKTAQIKEYKSHNLAEAEKFKTQKPPTQRERDIEINQQLDLIAEQRRAKEAERKLELKLKKQAVSEYLSLRNTIAWALCPNTIQVRKENADGRILKLFAKYEELEQISDELLAHKITREEAQVRIRALNLSKQDEISILAYHKKCWEISGTQEWSDALHKAKDIMQAYEAQGVDAIEDEKVRERVIRWEREQKITR